VRNINPEKSEGLSPELQTALQPLLAAIEALSEGTREYIQDDWREQDFTLTENCTAYSAKA